MIYLSISYGFSQEENRYHIEFVPENIQLSIYKYDKFIENEEYILNTLEEYNVNIRVLHLPIGCLKVPIDKIMDLIEFFNKYFNCKKFVIHPNKGIKYFVQKFNQKNIKATLCIENFQYRKKKQFRTPLDIIDVSIRNAPNIALTLDTSHTDDIWFDHKILPYILKYTSVIHLSNRNSQESHIPFNSPKGDLNLVGFVKDLKHRYNWSGDLVLEYLPKYSNKLFKNLTYIQRLLD